MKKELLVFITHISERIDRINRYSAGLSKANFVTSEETQDAITRNLEIIGEAVKNLSDEFKLKYPDIPWKKIVGFRDKLIHFYFGVDLDMAWDVIQKDLPPFKKQIKKILEDLQPKNTDNHAAHQ